MDASFKLKRENPQKDANCFSKLFFGWVIRLLNTGTKRTLRIDDLYKSLREDESEVLGDRLEGEWKEEIDRAKLEDRTPRLLTALTKVFMRQYFSYGFLVFFFVIFMRSPQPFVLAWLISQFRGETHDRVSMYSSATILVLMTTVGVFLFHHSNYLQSLVGMRVRIAVSSLVYRKILRLNRTSHCDTTAGQVVNLLSNDVQRFDLVCLYLHYLWIMPFQIAVMTYSVWRALGVSCLAGIVSMFLCTVPIQGYLGKLTSSLRLKMARRTDARVKLMSEIISGIQVMKMYAWERPFEKLIEHLRAKEIDTLTLTSYLRGYYLSGMVFIERATLCLTLVCYTLLGNHVTADVAFSAAQFFNILQCCMAIMYPMAISLGAETLVSVKRLEDFLVVDEQKESTVQTSDKPEVIMHNVSASWVSQRSVINKISFEVPQGKLCAIIGPVGSGKSSLLQILLGELPPTSGVVKLGGKISYAAQEPWLFAASVRHNILFGKPYDKTVYKKVVKVCALEDDFKQLSHGDMTRVGEKGASLSGGQRARINLARAIYRGADVYLLDDPLSAVDTHVGKHLFEKCILKHLKDTTRILVTHQLQYLKKADVIVVLNKGSVEAMGTFEDLSTRNLDFTKMLALADETDETKLEPSKEELNEKFGTSGMFNQEEVSCSEEMENEEKCDTTNSRPFLSYMKMAGGGCFVTFVIMVLVLSQVACTCTDLWVAFWTSQGEIRYSSILQTQHVEANDSYILHDNTVEYEIIPTSPQSKFLGFNHTDIFDEVKVGQTIYTLVKTNVALYVYGVLIILAIFLTVARSLYFFKASMLASKNIHSKMFHCLLRVPMAFFHENPSGRVLNRFSKDIGAIDDLLPRVLMESIQIFLVLFGILVNVGISNYWMIIPMVILGALFMKVRTWYVASAKDIKHLEGSAKSPVFSHISASLNGLTTIRASQAQKTLSEEFDDHQNVHTSAWFLTIICTVFFGLWLDIICIVFVTCVAFGFVISMDLGQTPNSSMVGLALSQAMILTGMLQYGMRQTAEVVNQLTSVERVLQYTKLDQEGPFDTPKEKLPVLPWPSIGRIEFKNLCLSYRPGCPVLKNLDVIIQSGEKVGIVGRTGAGKTSLISALFRLSPIEGSILIDDLNTNIVGLHDLRRKISIIPQEPVLFSASLRYNLDPFGEFPDDKLWEVLDEVELKEAAPSLEFLVSEGGKNFSLGQRQLVCLARALLRNNKILVLDEATANVDAKTDGLIQTTIRKKFKDCTVLTIAHRLNTIMDSDKVIVMEAGSIMELGHPHQLLQNDGIFMKMVEQTGAGMTEQLKNIASNAWKVKEESNDLKELLF